MRLQPRWFLLVALLSGCKQEEPPAAGCDHGCYTLPHCNTDPQAIAMPADPSAIDSIVPLGTVNPERGDVFGQDILFFQMKQEGGNPVSVALNATAGGRVTGIFRFEILDSDPARCTDDHVVLVHDYDLYIQSCHETLSTVIAARE